MKGFLKGLLYFVALAASVARILYYFHLTPDLSKVAALVPHSAPAASAVAVGAPLLPSSSESALPPSGVCYLTIPIKVPNQFGMVTYQRGTMVRYLGQQGDRLVVEKGDSQFTVSREMLGSSP